MLVEELEEKAAELMRKKDELRELNRQYKQFYSRDLREEMAAKKAEMAKVRAEVSELVWDNLAELGLIKAYFPGFFAALAEDPGIGAVIRKREWMINRKEEGKAAAEKKLREIRGMRKQLRDAREFVSKWPRAELDARSIVATWPVLKGALEGDVHRTDALSAIEKKDRHLIREGWHALLNGSMVIVPLKRFLNIVHTLKAEESAKQHEMAKSKGRGSVTEYEAKREYEEAKARRERMEHLCRHLLAASPAFLDAMRKELKAGRKEKGDLERIVAMTPVKRINEREWLKEMRAKLGTE